MKKLLLFAFTMGMSAMTFAQDGKISVDAIVSPTGTITTEDPANGTTLLEVEITNNETGFTYPGALTQLTFEVTVDGDKINDPNGVQIWVKQINLDLAPGGSQNVTLATDWGAVGDPGTHEICVKLTNMLVASGGGGLITNSDQNMEFCDNYEFAWPASINDLQTSEIANIKTVGDVMTVSVNNTSAVTEVKLMSITGQVVKTVTTSNGGQNFNQNFDISNLTSGVYIVTVQSENGATQAQKVFVQ